MLVTKHKTLTERNTKIMQQGHYMTVMDERDPGAKVLEMSDIEVMDCGKCTHFLNRNHGVCYYANFIHGLITLNDKTKDDFIKAFGDPAKFNYSMIALFKCMCDKTGQADGWFDFKTNKPLYESNKILEARYEDFMNSGFIVTFIYNHVIRGYLNKETIPILYCTDCPLIDNEDTSCSLSEFYTLCKKLSRGEVAVKDVAIRLKKTFTEQHSPMYKILHCQEEKLLAFHKPLRPRECMCK